MQTKNRHDMKMLEFFNFQIFEPSIDFSSAKKLYIFAVLLAMVQERGWLILPPVDSGQGDEIWISAKRRCGAVLDGKWLELEKRLGRFLFFQHHRAWGTWRQREENFSGKSSHDENPIKFFIFWGFASVLLPCGRLFKTCNIIFPLIRCSSIPVVIKIWVRRWWCRRKFPISTAEHFR